MITTVTNELARSSSHASEIDLDFLIWDANPDDEMVKEALATYEDEILAYLNRLASNSYDVPPRFRETTKPGQFHTDSEYGHEETLELRQRQMNDLIFLSKQGRAFSLHRKYEGLFIPGGGLDTRLANDFVEEKAWTLEQKANQLLGLTQFEQLQCCALASKQIQDRWRNSITYATGVENKLKAKAELDESFGQYVGEFVKLAQALYLGREYRARKLAQIFGWLTRKSPVSRQALKAKIKRLEKRLA